MILYYLNLSYSHMPVQKMFRMGPIWLPGSNVLMTNEMHNSYNQFLFHNFLSALHVSNESNHSSSGPRSNILYYTVQSVQSCYQASLAASS